SKKHFNRQSDLLHSAYQKLGLLMNIANRVIDYRVSKFGGVNHKVRGVLMYEERRAKPKPLASALTRSRGLLATSMSSQLTWTGSPSQRPVVTCISPKLSEPEIGQRPPFSRNVIEGLRDHFAFD